MPNTVLTGTAMSVIWRVSQKADWNAGRWSAAIDRLETALERAPEDEHDRQRQQEQQVDQRERPQREAGDRPATGTLARGLRRRVR